jgi:hypothetical protein
LPPFGNRGTTGLKNVIPVAGTTLRVPSTLIRVCRLSWRDHTEVSAAR